ncbi:hypothetical protein RBA09_07630 [Massilia sp. CCM 9029]|nr:hypothetical protein [Massilia sp. CCM 9029]MDQ1830607.1 hypothetical protein [Massilia sp. CCM 9029]
MQHADGAASSLYAHLASGRWLVLQVDRGVHGRYQPALDGAWVNAVTALVPGREAELDGVAALVVRPDGHVDHAVALHSSVTGGNPCPAQAVT